MSAGIKYNLTPTFGVEDELCRVETIYRLSGGFNLDDSDLASGAIVQPLCPIKVDFATRKAKVCKNVTVYEAYTTGSANLTIKIKKGSLAYVNMFLGSGTKGAKVTAIDKSKAEYDSLTIAAAFGEDIAVNKVLFDASLVDGTALKNVPNFLNYTMVKKEDGATITAVGKAFEIQSAKLIQPVSEKDKASLSDLFMFV